MSLKPQFELRKLDIRDLQGLKAVSLPDDGMSWDGRFPALSVIASANGSGKTTLLRCISQAARLLTNNPATIPSEVDARECRIDFCLHDGSRNTRQRIGTATSAPVDDLASCSKGHQETFG